MPNSVSASVRPLYAVALKLLSSTPPTSVTSQASVPSPILGLALPPPDGVSSAHAAARSASTPTSAASIRTRLRMVPPSAPSPTGFGALYAAAPGRIARQSAPAVKDLRLSQLALVASTDPADQASVSRAALLKVVAQALRSEERRVG